jgi:hypothetical protein
LTDTAPALSRDAIPSALELLRLHTEAVRLIASPFARLTASSSSATRVIVTTGPKLSEL